ncbi:AP1-like transcription factor-like protein [Saccharata proteae CBS 121410]|uniref:AP1-like transcription factor-like protein n=1 Tax=Saccharata proteae CBS 121410 TaxID=1314787 RepID=A0A9P4I4H2_9PEZI|nr:AP1-like transcription factor-like protein [Saccharata proteae CBS 121410]
MAGTANHEQYNPQLYLSPNQQDLLMAALNSNDPNRNPSTKSASYPANPANRSNSNSQQFSLSEMDPSFFASPQQGTPSTFGTFGVDESPYIDFLDQDGTFDFDANDTSDLMIGGLPGETSPGEGETDSGDKRKSPEDAGDEEEGGGKRREGEDKTAKKPGRKPLTSEPTTKRKAQNRAAQRAFRERKEKHLKDLETKVNELEKASDAANHENGLLRAQVERLQTELREYRKRLSLNSTSAARTGPTTAGFSSLVAQNTSGANNFQFEFPRFGALPGSQIFNNGIKSTSGKGSPGAAARPTPPSNAPGVLNRANSSGRSISPASHHSANRNSVDYTSPSASNNGPRGSTDSTGQPRVFQFNSHSNSSTNDSPTASSVSHYGTNSSCGTSPEPSHGSPGNDKANKDTVPDGYVCHGNTEGEVTFCEKLNMACGTSRNPIPRALSHSNGAPAPAAAATDPKQDQPDFGLDWFAHQNDNQFNPTLFGDYRESQAAVVGDGEFTGGFFENAFPATDFGSPFNFAEGITPGLPKTNPLEEIEKIQDGADGADDEVVPGEDPAQMLSCHKIWDKLQNRPDFKDGTIDIDSLCTELRAKARCSESGVVVDTKDVDAALKRLPKDML